MIAGMTLLLCGLLLAGDASSRIEIPAPSVASATLPKFLMSAASDRVLLGAAKTPRIIDGGLWECEMESVDSGFGTMVVPVFVERIRRQKADEVEVEVLRSEVRVPDDPRRQREVRFLRGVMGRAGITATNKLTWTRVESGGWSLRSNLKLTLTLNTEQLRGVPLPMPVPLFEQVGGQVVRSVCALRAAENLADVRREYIMHSQQ